jgi:hypothetical protein
VGLAHVQLKPQAGGTRLHGARSVTLGGHRVPVARPRIRAVCSLGSVVALEIDIDGMKHPLSLVEGSTENAILVNGLLAGLRERGLDATYLILVVLDGPRRRAAWCATPCCAGARRAWPRPANSSAASTATCTYVSAAALTSANPH